MESPEPKITDQPRLLVGGISPLVKGSSASVGILNALHGRGGVNAIAERR